MQNAMTSKHTCNKYNVLQGARPQNRLRAPMLSRKTTFSVYLFPARLHMATGGGDKAVVLLQADQALSPAPEKWVSGADDSAHRALHGEDER